MRYSLVLTTCVNMVILYVVLFCLVVMFLWRRKKHDDRLDFPGPRGLPIVGCYFSIRGKSIHDVLHDWSMQYGGAFKFSVFGKQFLVVNHPDTLREVLVTKGKAFAGRPTGYRFQTFSDNYQDIIVSSNLARNLTLRKAVHGVIKAHGAGRAKHAAILDTTVDDLVDKFDQTCGEPMDPIGSIFGATLVTIALLIGGQRIDEEILDLPEDLHLTDNESLDYSVGNALLDAVPFLRHLPWYPPGKKFRAVIATRNKTLKRLIGPALKIAKDSNEHTVGKALLDIVGQKYGEGDEAGEINMVNVKQSCLNLAIGGTTTTLNTFYALLNILQWNPDIQEKIYQEAMEVVGDGGPVVLEDRDKMPYSRAVVLEALRYVTVLPLGITHASRGDTSVGGIAVPRGTEVITDLWTCHHDPKLWPDPWTFKPERFLDEDGQLVLADHVNRKQLLAFGAGTRVCIGEVLALNRLFLFTTNCVKRFRFSPPEGADRASCDARKYKLYVVAEPPTYETIACPRMQEHNKHAM